MGICNLRFDYVSSVQTVVIGPVKQIVIHTVGGKASQEEGIDLSIIIILENVSAAAATRNKQLCGARRRRTH